MSDITDDITIDESVADREDILDNVARLIATLQQHPDPIVGEQVEALLAGIDAVHRTALTHLFSAIQGMGGETAVNQLTADPAIRLLLMSYDLLAVDRRLMTEEALDAVRGHLHAHGVDVELLDVVGSEVFVKLHGVDQSELTLEAARHDVEAALREGPIGFQLLTIGERDQQKPPALVQLAGRRPMQRPVYHSVIGADDLAPGEVRGADVNDQPVLLANVAGEIYAVANRCGDSPLPLEFSTLQGAILVCSWHGCQYDLRTGERIDVPDGNRLRVFPVRVEAGDVQIAVGVEQVPRDVAGSMAQTTA
ncbi:MAG: Rieske 2Fe-2S domain-containing protein [Gemmatimonadota bacterium]|nr:Rieske 2Fe-2S domain-containing protein [Gemmatimonadota bacterium]